jgi:hypothetical protein
MRKGLVFGSGAVDNLKERAKCQRCGQEYGLLSKAASEAIGGLCAACWHEKKSHEGGEREVKEDKEPR